ncbi:MAG: flagellar basal-body rod protein FlgF [Proteobacteria bacterium]|nr:flagellar basal-body rod protein FlgF [Pseudomonadota bacterium]MBU1709414.1 flagellar basal-body rod protein FlgF [Pseudomonadota bacterium]
MYIQNRLGLIESVETMLRQENRLSQVANNLANVDTTGFKKENVTFWEMLYKASGNRHRVGKGAKIITDHQQGPTQLTGNPLDIAINGEGYFKIQTQRGMRYTRDGNFHKNSQGQVTTSNGDLLMGQGGAITIEGGIVTIDNQGSVYVDGNLADQLAIVTFADTNGLEKEGLNMYRTKSADVQEQTPEEYTLEQGYLEESNVNTVKEMTEMIELQRVFEAQQKVIRTIDEINDEAIRRVGKLT